VNEIGHPALIKHKGIKKIKDSKTLNIATLYMTASNHYQIHEL
jgi:hypothetical protein